MCTDHSVLCGVSMSILPRQDPSQANLILRAGDLQLTAESACEAVMLWLGWSTSHSIHSTDHDAPWWLCRAEVTDTDAIMDLLTPLAVAGITRMRTRQDILQDLCQFTVVERENKVCSAACQAWP